MRRQGSSVATRKSRKRPLYIVSQDTAVKQSSNWGVVAGELDLLYLDAYHILALRGNPAFPFPLLI